MNIFRNAMNRKNDEGITLAELVIVVVIFAILGGVGFSLYQSHQRAEARAAAWSEVEAEQQATHDTLEKLFFYRTNTELCDVYHDEEACDELDR